MRLVSSRLGCAIALAFAATFPAQAEVFINEIHYDNLGADVGEAIEVVGSAGENLAGYQLVLYNGSNNQTYRTDTLPEGNLAACGGQVRFAVVNYPQDGLQNGSPDGVALIDPQGGVVQFLSYEGTMTADNGPAAGVTSTDIGVSQPNSTPVGLSLQLGGEGNVYADFTWAESATATFGACNNGQTFGEPGNAAPRVVETFPAEGSNNFPYAADMTVTFSEPVVVQPGAFSLNCEGLARRRTTSLDHVGQATSFTLTPARPLIPGQACSLHIDADLIVDLDDTAPESDATIDFHVKRADRGTGDGEYYGLVNDSSPDQLRCSLHETIRGHVVYPYSGSGTSTWTILEIADEDPNDPGKILDVYRNRSYTKGSDRSGTGTGTYRYNREHTWPNSLGFPSNTGNLGLPNAPYTDTHMLYLSDEAYNSNRGNMPFADCTTGCTERPTEFNNGRGGGSGAYPGNSNWYQGPNGNLGSFEAWGARKGDMARAVLYMAIRYEGGTHPTTGQSEPDLELTDNRNLIVGTSSSPAYMGLLSTLLEWHLADPPDDAERARNEVVFAHQGNRNPFIDYPEWATAELFNSTTPATCELGVPPSQEPRNPRLRDPRARVVTPAPAVPAASTKTLTTSRMR